MTKRIASAALFSALICLSSCQKELTKDDTVLPDCAVSSITLRDAATSTLLARYSFEYDAVTHRPSLLSYQNYGTGVTRSIQPSYHNDTVRWEGGSSYLALDGSKRISRLKETNAITGIENGDYYYEYNQQGQMTERLLDDGVNDVKRTTFSFTNDTLTRFVQDFTNFPEALTATLGYISVQKLAGFGEYNYLQVYPELLLYMPLLKIGETPIWPLGAINTVTNRPGIPLAPTATNYSNYVLTTQGWIASFETESIRSGAIVKTVYEFDYHCF